MTISRFGDMLPLPSISRPTVTGRILTVEKLDRLWLPVLQHAKRILPETGDVSAATVLYGDVQNHQFRLG